MHAYDNTFFKYVNTGAINSANEILPILIDLLPIKSVLDVGCGQGAWLSVWVQCGVNDVLGIDGDYVDKENLLISRRHFTALNLANEFSLDRQFDLVQSLEVAEHLPESSARQFVSNLVRHGNLVLFSAAPKGQGGEYHINEQDYDYWRALFAEFGYLPVDLLRPLIQNNNNIEPWYRYNSFLYGPPGVLGNLSPQVQQSIVQNNVPLRDISPPLYKFRKMLIRFLPVFIVTAIARIKERIFTLLRN